MRGIDLFYFVRGSTLRQVAQVLAGFEANRVAGRNRNFDTGLRVSTDAALAALDLKDPEAAQLDSIPGSESRAHGLDHRLDGGRGLGPGDLGEVHHAIHDVGFNHGSSGVPELYNLLFLQSDGRREGRR